MPFFDLSGSDSISSGSCILGSVSMSNAEQGIHDGNADQIIHTWADASIGSSLMDMASDPMADDAGRAASLTPPTATSPIQAPLNSDDSGPKKQVCFSQLAISATMPPSGLLDGDKCNILPPPRAALPEKEKTSESYPCIECPEDSPADPPAAQTPSPQVVVEKPLSLVDQVTKPSSSASSEVRAPAVDPGVPLRITTTSRVPIPNRPLAYGKNNLFTTSAHARSIYSPTKPRPVTQLLKPTPKKLPASAVEDVTEVILPPGFFNARENAEDECAESSQLGGERKSQDAISRLAELLIKAGGEDKAGIFKYTPSKNSAWKNRIKMLPKWPPTYPPPDVSDSSDSSVSSASSVSSLPNPMGRKTSAAARRQQRKDLANWAPKSLAQEVYGDSRYFSSRAEKGKLVVQEGWEEMGPFEMTKFRDYRLYPADTHLIKILGLNSRKANKAKVKETAESDEESFEEVTSRGRKRKRVRRLAEEQRLTTPRKRGVGRPKKEGPAAGRTRVGDKYQACVAARPFSNLRESDSSNVPECTQLWDPQKAAAAEARGEDIDGFLQQATDLSSKTVLMEALHRSGYSVEKAADEFIKLYRLQRETSCHLDLDEMFEQTAMLENGNKDFYAIAAKLGRSVSSVLVNYYQWKGCNLTCAYDRCKKRWNNESDWCHVCQDGGQMIVCEHCHHAYHLHCLNPPLKRVPRGDWFCPGCMKSPAKLNRAAGSFSRPQLQSTKRTLGFSESISKPQVPQVPIAQGEQSVFPVV